MEAQLTLTVGDSNNKDVSLIGTKQEYLNSNASNSVVDKISKKNNEKRKRPKPMSTDSSKCKRQKIKTNVSKINNINRGLKRKCDEGPEERKNQKEDSLHPKSTSQVLSLPSSPDCDFSTLSASSMPTCKGQTENSAADNGMTFSSTSHSIKKPNSHPTHVTPKYSQTNKTKKSETKKILSERNEKVLYDILIFCK